jgi:hypothetical protein
MRGARIGPVKWRLNLPAATRLVAGILARTQAVHEILAALCCGTRVGAVLDGVVVAKVHVVAAALRLVQPRGGGNAWRLIFNRFHSIRPYREFQAREGRLGENDWGIAAATGAWCRSRRKPAPSSAPHGRSSAASPLELQTSSSPATTHLHSLVLSLPHFLQLRCF